MNHPNDDTGDALRRLEADGDDLTRPREIDFTVVFPDELHAERFAEYFRERGHAVSVRFSQVRDGLPWDVKVVNNMAPSHQGIAGFETELQDLATTLGGENDGWGCFTEPGKHLH
jgi:hypothetical protein